MQNSQTGTVQLQLNGVARRVAKRLCTTASFALAAGQDDYAFTCFCEAGDLLRLARQR